MDGQERFNTLREIRKVENHISIKTRLIAEAETPQDVKRLKAQIAELESRKRELASILTSVSQPCKQVIVHKYDPVPKEAA